MNELKENLPVYGKVAWILVVLIAVELIMLMLMIPAKSTFHWITATVIVICIIYLVRMVFLLIKELKKRV